MRMYAIYNLIIEFQWFNYLNGLIGSGGQVVTTVGFDCVDTNQE